MYQRLTFHKYFLSIQHAYHTCRHFDDDFQDTSEQKRDDASNASKSAGGIQAGERPQYQHIAPHPLPVVVPVAPVVLPFVWPSIHHALQKPLGRLQLASWFFSVLLLGCAAGFKMTQMGDAISDWIALGCAGMQLLVVIFSAVALLTPTVSQMWLKAVVSQSKGK